MRKKLKYNKGKGKACRGVVSFILEMPCRVLEHSVKISIDPDGIKWDVSAIRSWIVIWEFWVLVRAWEPPPQKKDKSLVTLVSQKQNRPWNVLSCPSVESSEFSSNYPLLLYVYMTPWKNVILPHAACPYDCIQLELTHEGFTHVTFLKPQSINCLML